MHQKEKNKKNKTKNNREELYFTGRKVDLKLLIKCGSSVTESKDGLDLQRVCV